MSNPTTKTLEPSVARAAAGSAAGGYSERYNFEIDRAREAWERRMDRLPHVEVTDEMYDAGLDAMPQEWRDVQQEVFEERLHVGNYELSYSQMCRAAFGAGHGALKINWA